MNRRSAWLLAAVVAVSLGFWWWPKLSATIEYSSLAAPLSGALAAPPAPVAAVTHLPTPPQVRAVYLSSWSAGTKSMREKIVELIESTELNAVVIDVKDYTGRIALPVSAGRLVETGAVDNRVPDIREFIAELHRRNIYVIARIAAFQDPYLVGRRPDLAVKRQSDGEVWADYKGAKWLDPAAPEVWGYLGLIGREAYAVGFDELNFDYIRFPSDGDIKNISYPFFDETRQTKPEALEQFFSHLVAALADTPAPLSADFFGMTTTNTDDLNIGQVLERAAPYFDFIAPMVYPSHYPAGFLQFKNPAARPYEVIHHSLTEAVARLAAAGFDASKLRPWLQDFDLGAVYTAEMIREEKRAVYDAGLDSWMLWSPRNQYTAGALDKPESQL